MLKNNKWYEQVKIKIKNKIYGWNIKGKKRAKIKINNQKELKGIETRIRTGNFDQLSKK